MLTRKRRRRRSDKRPLKINMGENSSDIDIDMEDDDVFSVEKDKNERPKLSAATRIRPEHAERSYSKRTDRVVINDGQPNKTAGPQTEGTNVPLADRLQRADLRADAAGQCDPPRANSRAEPQNNHDADYHENPQLPDIPNRRRRGTRAGAYRQQQRFMRFLFQLSHAHVNWGRPRQYSARR
ncbi:uncharacterized protein LOC118644714 [Monomorium pharaonis]|uniref:uncharacterized protein LOC118644714 n=1 Tax=Monomorium pharaonis TaxID=307658 RepID=UPI001747CC31|nr:uncharacterized protein LOC118644714 [Monomorium pharaonis]